MVRFPSPEELVGQYIPASPIAAAMGDVDTAVVDAVIRDVEAALQPFVSDGGLAFPMENHLAVAVRPS
jgi:hypothetical protein